MVVDGSEVGRTGGAGAVLLLEVVDEDEGRHRPPEAQTRSVGQQPPLSEGAQV